MLLQEYYYMTIKQKAAEYNGEQIIMDVFVQQQELLFYDCDDM